MSEIKQKIYKIKIKFDKSVNTHMIYKFKRRQDAEKFYENSKGIGKFEVYKNWEAAKTHREIDAKA